MADVVRPRSTIRSFYHFHCSPSACPPRQRIEFLINIIIIILEEMSFCFFMHNEAAKLPNLGLKEQSVDLLEASMFSSRNLGPRKTSLSLTTILNLE